MSPVRYAGGPLDRAAKLREDDDWVSAALVSDAAVAVLIHKDQNLVTKAARREDTRAAIIPLSIVRERVTAKSASWVFLGLDGEVPVFSVDVSADALADLPEIHDAGEFVDLRRIGSLVPAGEAALLAYARAMLSWHRRYRFCSVCGSPMESERAGHLRRCTNPDCRAEWFPRTDPVVIMLVTRPPSGDQPARCLLGRHSRLPSGAYSLLAGFVEPGESLEDAVAREVWEETGVRVDDVRYQASQPWPFPYSMMVGFRAVGETDDIVLDADELEDARWFTAAQVAAFGEWDDDSASFRRPRKDSIARYLLDQWVAEHAIQEGQTA
jgi:NAD+ diphosphatase